jgi:glutamyl-tRNA reductase
MALAAVFGLNHASANLANLEQFAFSTEEIAAALRQLSSNPEVQEGVMLATCNRLEIYAVFEQPGIGRQALSAFLKHARPAALALPEDSFYYKEGADAINHLFAVTSGLDSLVVGENEIGGQVKRAYQLACDVGANGLLTNKLFHAAFRTSKRVKTETCINAGNCSVGCVAVDLAAAHFHDLRACRVMVIGAGEIGRVVAKTFADRGVKTLLIANRSLRNAEALADEVGGAAISLERVEACLDQPLDIVVSGTGSPAYLLRSETVRAWRQRHPDHPLMLVDIALPRDFDPEIAGLPQIVLKNLYDLREVVAANLKKRAGEIPKGEAIVRAETQKFLRWNDTLKLSHTIKMLNLSFDAIRQRELERYQHQFAAETLPQLDAFTKSLTQKYLHLILSNVKTLANVCDLDERQVHILEHLFDSHGATHDTSTHCRHAGQCPGAGANRSGQRAPASRSSESVD